MKNTPLYTALTKFAAEDTLRMHMPGHKGRPLPMLDWGAVAAVDFTELPETGNLYEGGDVIAAAESLWAEAWGMPACQFLTGGSTQGIYAALLCACTPGDAVLLDRGSHRSVYNAAALLDLQPRWLPRMMDAPIDPAALDAALKAAPEVNTVCIVSPTYYGALSDIPALAAVAHAHGAALIVDAAHGCHLPFLGENPFAAADLVVTSAHKTLPALGQGALLFGGVRYPAAALRTAAAVTGTSSPSYPIMASLDVARAYMEGRGRGEYAAAITHVSALRTRFAALTEGVDPARLTLCVSDGYALQEALQGQGVYPEMADGGHVVFICTGRDCGADFARLERALTACGAPPAGTRDAPLPAPPPPETAMSLREALFAPRRMVPLREAEGEIAARSVAPYPPGIPVIAPGEVVTKKHLAYLCGIGYNGERNVEVVQKHEEP